MRKLVLVTDPIHEQAMALLNSEAEATLALPDVPISEQMKGVSALLVRRRLGPEVVAAADLLEVIARHGVGLDFIPMEAATAHRIPVVYAPFSNTDSVVEHTLAFMLALSKDLCTKSALAKSGRWNEGRFPLGIELRGRTVGIIGLGRIGSRVAQTCREGFGMRVLAFDPAIDAAQAGALGVQLVKKRADLLQEADFVTLHAPLIPQTQGIIGAEALAMMKPTAYLINAARGALVDEVALNRALAEHRIAGAALDVLVDDPPAPDHSLLSLPNVILTPHSAALTEEAFLRMGMDSCGDILRVFRCERPVSLANPEIWDDRITPAKP